MLRTKLFVPPVRPDRVTRTRLLELMDSGLDKALILVSAPAGYGKTTLVSSWLVDVRLASTWLSLDEGDNDPLRFLQYLLAALHEIVPDIKLDLLDMLQGKQPDAFGALMSLLINEIAGHAASFVLVLDDFHLIQNEQILEILDLLLKHMPLQMHLVLLSRTDPPLPLARLRARFQLLEIRASQLRFTPDEMAIFLNKVMGLKLSASDIAALEARTEGWIAGIQLAALSMQGIDDVHGFVSAFTGSHAYIMDYLAEEVLKIQPERVRTFLLHTSILDRLCGSLCEALITENETPVDGQGMLEELEEKNLFVVPLDNERRWFRYHHLFADVLTRRLEHLLPGQLPDLHRRASHWYETHGFIPEATQHSLLAGDQARAAQLIVQNGCDIILRGEVVTLLAWLEAVEPYAQAHPWLAIQKAWALSLTGRLDSVEPLLQAAENKLAPLKPTTEVRIMLGTIAAARAHTANMRGEAGSAAEFARQALEYLPDNDPFPRSLRSLATAILGDAIWVSGDLEDAERVYREAVHIGQSADNKYLVIIASSNLADVLVELGQLHQAARIYSEALRLAIRPDGRSSPLAESIYAGLGRISYEWNHLEAAAQYHQQSIALCQQWGNFDLLASGYVFLARLEQAQGKPEQAKETMHLAQQLVSEDRLSTKRSIWVKSALARWWIAQGNLERASLLLQQTGIALDVIPGEGELPSLQKPEVLTQLRLLLAQGDYDSALALSERLLRMAENSHRGGRVIELLVLQALVYQSEKELDRSLAILERAVSLAEQESYVRTFLDEGEPIVKLLYQVKSRRVGAGYASELLSAIGKATGAELPPTQLLIEPLTSRELEVLKMIEAGYSNQEIADGLVISLTTVKRHISNIYAKLGATSRTQAVARARELRLFE